MTRDIDIIIQINHNEKLVKVDFIVKKETEYRKEEFRRRKQVSIAGINTDIVAAEDLNFQEDSDMKDTSIKIEKLFHKLCRNRSGEERLKGSFKSFAIVAS